MLGVSRRLTRLRAIGRSLEKKPAFRADHFKDLAETVHVKSLWHPGYRTVHLSCSRTIVVNTCHRDTATKRPVSCSLLKASNTNAIGASQLAWWAPCDVVSALVVGLT